MVDFWEKEKIQTLRSFHKHEKDPQSTEKFFSSGSFHARSWPEKYHEAVLLQSHLYLITPKMKSVVVKDWEENNLDRVILLEPRLSIQDQLKIRFKIAKKLERAIPHLEKRLEILNQQSLKLSERIKEASIQNSAEEWENYKKVNDSNKTSVSQKKIDKKPPRLPYKIFHSVKGIEIWVGKTAKDNEKLSLKLASGNDWWIHASDVPGSHVVVKSSEPDEETLRYAMALAIQHSRLKKCGEGEVIVTQCKFVSKGPGKHKPGTVSVSKHKKYKIYSKN